MKRFLTEILDRFLGSPVMPMMVVIFSICTAILSSDSILPEPEPEPEYVYKDTMVQIADLPVTTSAATSAVTTSASTSAASSTSSAVTSGEVSSTAGTTVQTTGESKPNKNEETSGEQPQPEKPAPPSYDYSYINAGESPNSDFYQARLTIVGDSIASGFCAYGYIPAAHSVARESLALWNMGRYTFDMGGGEMSLVDAAAYVNSPLYLISIGMNDILGMSPDDYAWRMRDLAEQLLERVPTATVVVGAITPVSADNYYTTNDVLRSFNDSLEYVINDAGNPRLLFFNTHAVLIDPDYGCLSGWYAGGDGLHLSSSAYSHALSCLFSFLDETSAIDQINEHDNNF